jgi:hypothetical protein
VVVTHPELPDARHHTHSLWVAVPHQNPHIMVKVYFETDSPKYAELVAIFDDEATYAVCLPALEKLCKKHHFDYITESVDDGERINDLD